MARVHISIAGLMGTIAGFSLLWASMRYASEVCANLVFTATLGVFGVATLGGVFGIGQARAGWAGFAWLGGGYLALCYAPGFGSEVRPHLATSALIDRIGPWVVHPRVVMSRSVGMAGMVIDSSALATPDDIAQSPTDGQPVITSIASAWPATIFYRSIGMGNPQDFQRIGHCWLALGLGLIGGTLARRFRRPGGGLA